MNEDMRTRISESDSTVYHANDNTDSVVNHPLHYAGGTKNFECIEAMELTFGARRTMDWCLQTAYKYIWRMGQKTGNDSYIDAQKAMWYLNKYDDIRKNELCGDATSPHDEMRCLKLRQKALDILSEPLAKSANALMKE